MIGRQAWAFRNDDGFILAATLWILAAISLLAGFFSFWSGRAVELARQSQEDMQDEIDQASTRSVLLYLLAARPMTVAGLILPTDDHETELKLRQRFTSSFDTIDLSPLGSELPLDDSIFAGVGTAMFSIQDEGGLIGINTLDNNPQLVQLLGLLEVPSDQRAPLMDKLADYMDRDDLHRLNGAEAGYYQEHNLPLPPNRFLMTSWELRAVADFAGYVKLWQESRLPRLTTVARLGMPNFNTAPSLVLQTIVGIDSEIATKIITAREKKAFQHDIDIYLAVGRELPLDPMSLFFLPTSLQRLTIWSKGKKFMQEIHVKLTPSAANHSPWLIDYEVTIPLSKEQEEKSGLVQSSRFKGSPLDFCEPKSSKL